MARIYDIEPYRQKIMEESLRTMTIEQLRSCRMMCEHIQFLGFKSCKFVNPPSMNNAYWEMSDEEFTWFVLRFS